MYSLVLKNAKIIDGTGKPAYTADIGIPEIRSRPSEASSKRKTAWT